MVPAQGSYAKYLQDALSQELAEANLLDPKSKVKVSATLLKNDIDAQWVHYRSGMIEAALLFGDLIRWRSTRSSAQ